MGVKRADKQRYYTGRGVSRADHLEIDDPHLGVGIPAPVNPLKSFLIGLDRLVTLPPGIVLRDVPQALPAHGNNAEQGKRFAALPKIGLCLVDGTTAPPAPAGAPGLGLCTREDEMNVLGLEKDRISTPRFRSSARRKSFIVSDY